MHVQRNVVLEHLEGREQHPSQLDRPSEIVGLVDGVGEKAIVVASDERRYGIDLIDHIHETNLREPPTSSSAQPPAMDPQTQDSKLRAKDALMVAWHGIELLLKKVERCLDGTPAKVPVAAINAVIDLKNVRWRSQFVTCTTDQLP